MRSATLLGLATTALLAGCGGTDGPGGEVGEIHLYDDRFEFATKEVKGGEKIEFENEGARKHTVTIHKAGDALDKLLHDKEVDTGQSTDFTFSAAGTYHVWCKYHGQMTSGMAMVVTVT